MLKKIILLLLCVVFAGFSAQAQRFGYIDSQVILEKMPEYKEVLEELDKQAETWEKQVQTLEVELIKLKTDFEAEKPLLTEEMKQKRASQIAEAETKTKEEQDKIFGINGLLFKKQEELMKPLQDKIAEAVRKMARKRKLSFIFDKAADLSMIYSDPTHNYTDILLEDLGLNEKDKKDALKKESDDGEAGDDIKKDEPKKETLKTDELKKNEVKKDSVKKGEIPKKKN